MQILCRLTISKFELSTPQWMIRRFSIKTIARPGGNRRVAKFLVYLLTGNLKVIVKDGDIDEVPNAHLGSNGDRSFRRS